MRCINCRRKTIFEYDCKCKKKFCLSCLPHFVHNCSYDYKADNKLKLEENNPKITTIKVSTI